MTAIRPAAVAGMFYPADPAELNGLLQDLLAAVPTSADAVPPKAIIAPHAGYVYSGAVAARVYARLKPLAGKVTRVVLLGPAHRYPVEGLAATAAEAWHTPLGDVPVDQDALARIADLPGVHTFDRAFDGEHSLEVHLPFLRSVLGEGFAVVPLVVGRATPDDVARVLDALWGGPETLIVISSDLSHFHDYDTCRAIDTETTAAIERLDETALTYDRACGRMPIAGLLVAARQRRMAIETIDVRNSGDTAGPRDRVVGYGTWALTEPDDAATADPEEQVRRTLALHGPDLLMLAAAAIRHGVRHGGSLPLALDALPEPLRRPGAAFVTLTLGGALRGCIGSVVAHRALGLDVADNAQKAAFRDPRFPPVGESEMPRLEVSLSVLSEATPMTFRDQDDLLAQMRPGIDGLILEDHRHRGLFLPSVWEQLPDAREFLGHLKLKAGLPAHHWSPTLTVSRFTTQGVKSRDLPDPAALWAAD